MALNLRYVAEPTLGAFHRSNAFVRGVRGPIGSGKSVACVVEIVRRAIEQTPWEGVRKSRWAVIRNTYPELKSTTVKTFQDWVDESAAPIKWDIPINTMLEIRCPDGTRVECEILFLSCDRPQDVKKLKSLDLTGVWLNEATELPKAILDMATGRVGRYPAKAFGGPSWSGVIMDTNAPDDDHWWYGLAEGEDQEGLALQEELKAQLVELGVMGEDQEFFEFFAQPPVLTKTPDGKWIPNPEAENVRNHTLGYGYWMRQLPGKTLEWIKVYVLGQYGTVHDGKPVYPEYNDALHCRAVKPIKGTKLDIGLDFGLTPAAVICQKDAWGKLLVLDELCGEDMDFRQFLQDILIPQLTNVYPEWWANKDELIRCIGDPAGEQKSQADAKTCFEEAKAAGLKIKAAVTNSFLPRRGAVAWFMSKLSVGKPMLVLDPCCHLLRKGFNGGYKYRRVQVTGEERYTDEPVKNRFSHPHDALQYIALEYGGVQAMKKGELKAKKEQKLPEWKPFDAEAGW